VTPKLFPGKKTVPLEMLNVSSVQRLEIAFLNLPNLTVGMYFMRSVFPYNNPDFDWLLKLILLETQFAYDIRS